jgi:hypothetical protein
MKVLLYTVFKELATAGFVEAKNDEWPFENELAGSRTREASN